MLILIYNESSNRIEKYNRTLGQVMPYIKNNYLTVKEFKGSSKTQLLWSSKRSMEAFNLTSQRFREKIYVGYAFKRIFEGGHSGQSQHYAGKAFDCGQKWSVSKRKDLYNLCKKIDVWNYVEPIRLTPSWVHFDDRSKPPACGAGFPLIKLGSVNTYVLLLQDGLINLGYSLLLDGYFGKETTNVVKSFQKKYNLKADGIVGCATWKKFTSIVTGMGKSKYSKYYS